LGLTIGNGRLLKKVSENKSNDDTRVKAEVTSIHEHDYKEVEDAVKDKYLLEGGAMYITKHKNWVKNFLFYKAPHILVKSRVKTDLCRTPRVSPNMKTKANTPSLSDCE
jgi:hypothetical protein